MTRDLMTDIESFGSFITVEHGKRYTLQSLTDWETPYAANGAAKYMENAITTHNKLVAVTQIALQSLELAGPEHRTQDMDQAMDEMKGVLNEVDDEAGLL